MEKFSKLMVLFILISFSFVFIACDDTDNYEDQYPAKIQAEAQKFCEYWYMCGEFFYGIEGDGWDGTISGCKKFFYQNYEIYENQDYDDDNYQCYICIMGRHVNYLSRFTDGTMPTVDQCGSYPKTCYMSSGDCQPPEDK